MNKLIYVLGAVVVGGFGVLGVMRMIEVQTPYLTLVSQVRSIKDRPVRFAGTIVQGGTFYRENADELVFHLRDTAGETIRVRYTGLKPPGFDSANGAVVRGSCYQQDFIATQIVLSDSSDRARD